MCRTKDGVVVLMKEDRRGLTAAVVDGRVN